MIGYTILSTSSGRQPLGKFDLFEISQIIKKYVTKCMINIQQQHSVDYCH